MAGGRPSGPRAGGGGPGGRRGRGWLLAALALLILAGLAGLTGLDGRAESAAPAQSAVAYVPQAVWPAPAGEPLAVALWPDGASVSVEQPRRAETEARVLVRREAEGTVTWRRVARDGQGNELRPVAVAAGPGGSVYLATERLLVQLDADGRPLWTAPAGDGHPDFGPAARGLAAFGGSLFGVDLANARVLGYRADNGALRLRLGTAGVAAGSYLAPLDVAVSPGGELLVAEHGNQRLQRLDGAGNPLSRWPLPARPRAVAVDGAGRVFALLEDETVRVLDGGGRELGRFGGFGREPGRLDLAWDLALGADGRVLVADRGNARLAVFRPAAPGETPPPLPSPPGATPEPTPLLRRAAACPGRPVQVDLDVAVPPGPPRADLLLVVDTTGSMESLLSTIRERVGDLHLALAGTSADLAIGLVDVRDYPYGRAGLATDWPWRLRSPLSTDPAALAAAVADLWAGGGGDAPEAYAGALVAALDDPRVGWRPGARRFLLLLGDAVPRDRDLNEGLADPVLPGVWAPGQPAWWRDSGPDWAPGTADDPRWLELLARLRQADVTLLVGLTGVAPVELAGNPGGLLRYWRQWAERTAPGGSAVTLTDLAALPERLAELVAGPGRRLARLAAVAGPAGYSTWVRFEPQEYLDLDVPPEGLTRRFAATVSPPPETADGPHTLVLDAIGDGGLRYASLELALDWRATCEPSPTAGPPTASPTASPSPSATATRTATATASPSATPRASATARPQPPLLLPVTLKGHCLGTSRLRSDIALVLDSSSSMRAEGKLDAALAAAGAFLDLIDLRRDRAAVLSFDSAAHLGQGLTGDRARLQAALAGIVAGEGTRLDLGLGAGLDELTGPRGRGGARRVIVLLTDGRPDGGTEAALDAASGRARAAGVVVYTIGLGSDLDAALLRRLAGDASRYYPAPSAEDLASIYRRIAETLPCR